MQRFLVLSLPILVSACVGGGGAPVAGGGSTGNPAEDACRAAIVATVNRPASDVVVYQATPSEGGTLVKATVAGATAPWQCVANADGSTSGVMFTGRDGD